MKTEEPTPIPKRASAHGPQPLLLPSKAQPTKRITRCFKTFQAFDTEDLDEMVNDLASRHLILNVDAHCYEDMWYAFILYEVEGV